MRKKAVGVAVILVFLVAPFLEVVNSASEPATVENSWGTKTPMKAAKADFGVATVDGRIYVITESTTEEYDPVTGNWTQKQPMLTSRSNFAVAVYKDKIYVIGGTTGFAPAVKSGVYKPIVTGANEEYDPATNTWETKTPMPTPRRALQANTVGDKIYLIGGILQGPLDALLPMTPIYSNLNEVYNPSTNNWTSRASSLTAVSSYLSAVIDDKIYVLSSSVESYDSYTDRWVLNSLNQVYDTQTDNWTLGSPMPIPVGAAGAGSTTGVFAPKRIYLIGGCPAWSGPDFYHGINTTQVYNIDNDTWTVGADMPTRRRELAVAVMNDTLYAIGGISGDDALATVEQYIPVGYETPSPPSPNKLPTTLSPCQLRSWLLLSLLLLQAWVY